MDLAFGSNIFNQNARKCEGKSADAVLKKHCSTPNSTKWTKGVQVRRRKTRNLNVKLSYTCHLRKKYMLVKKG